MKKLNVLLLLLTVLITNLSAQDNVRPFQHLSVSANAGTMGAGVQVASPINNYVSLRAGLMMFKYTYDYDYDGVIYYEGYEGEMPIPMKAKANMVNGLLLADIFPFRNKIFHLTAGFYMGTSDIIKVSAEYARRPVEIGDLIITPGASGRAAADIETKAFKPYVGFGLGNSVTKGNRVGFKFELGAMFHGCPKFVIKEGAEITDLDGLEISDDLSSFNKFLKNFNVYPVLNFQLNFRAF